MAKRRKRSDSERQRLEDEKQPFIEAYAATCFSNKVRIQEYEQEDAAWYREQAKMLGLNDDLTEHFVRNKIRVKRLTNTIANNAVRPLAHSAKVGQKIIRKQRLRAIATNEKRAAKRPDFKALVAEAMKRQPSYQKAVEQVAADTDYSERCVRKHAPNPAPKNRGRWKKGRKNA